MVQEPKQVPCRVAELARASLGDSAAEPAMERAGTGERHLLGQTRPSHFDRVLNPNLPLSHAGGATLRTPAVV